MKKATREAAAQHRPAQTKRKNRVRPYGLKREAFQTENDLTSGKGRKVGFQAYSLDGEAQSPAASLDKSALGKGWGAWGEGEHRQRRRRGSPSPQTIIDSVSRPYSAVMPRSRLTATASPCAPPPAMRASSAWRSSASRRVQSVKVLLPRTCLLT